MQGWRPPLATLLLVGLSVSIAFAGPKPTASLGTILSAEKARVGDSAAEVGTTVYSGDRLATDQDDSASASTFSASASCFRACSRSARSLKASAMAPSLPV